MAKCSRCGKNGIFQKTYHGFCLSCLNLSYAEEHAQLEDLKNSSDPMVVQHADLKKDILKLQITKEELEKQTESIRERIRKLEKDLLVPSDSVEMESFSLYRPKFSFTRSDEYKERLDIIRERQKTMIREKTAATCSQKWSVNGSISEGKKMTADIIKLILRSFNNECDIAVDSVRFNNFDRCKDRIIRSFDTLNKLGNINNVSISKAYANLKIDELHLALEYQQMKQEEKERQRELKEQQREEARLAKEIEDARKETEKEKKHFLKAMQEISVKISDCKNEEERKALIEKQTELTSHIDEITAKLADIDYRQSNQKAGYVYIISNIGSFGEGVYKIGMTRRLEPMDRIDELGDASVPFRFDVHALIFSEDAPKLEAALHREFDKYRVNMVNNRREYFRVSLDEIKRVVKENHDKTVDFIDVPAAEQYRESLIIANNAK